MQLKTNRLLMIVGLVGALFPSGEGRAHSPMFPDYFEYDPSNGGESLRPEKMASMARTECVSGDADGFPCQQVDLLAVVPTRDMRRGNLSDIWGWTDPVTGQEIAIVTQVNGTSFVDVTDGEKPVVLGFLHTGGGTDLWRDAKTYNNHVFIVADGFINRQHGLQVFDLTQLRDLRRTPTIFIPTARFKGFGNAHNIAINEDTGFAYVVGSNACSGGLYMLDISTPTKPKFAGCFSVDGYTHDVQCVVYNGPDTDYKGHEICVAYNEDTVTIVDVSNKSDPVQISRTSYAGVGYTHQGWFLDDNHEIILADDELDELIDGVNTTTHIFDVSDLDSPFSLGTHVSSVGAIDHNIYTRDGVVYQANYRAGLRILTTENIRNGSLTEVGFFDSSPDSDAPQFSGVWSSYVYFNSGNIIFSDIGTGLFIVKPNIEIPYSYGQ